MHHVPIFLLGKIRYSVPIGYFCKTHALQLFALKFFGTCNEKMCGNVYDYAVIILSEHPRVENDCEALENRKMKRDRKSKIKLELGKVSLLCFR